MDPSFRWDDSENGAEWWNRSNTAPIPLQYRSNTAPIPLQYRSNLNYPYKLCKAGLILEDETSHKYYAPCNKIITEIPLHIEKDAA